ncbi:MAG: LAGLIDADG family homing endonuclease [Nanoarchaeota archaeon]
MKFNEDLAAIHAYLCADGYVVKNPPTQKHKYYHVGLRNTNILLLEDFQKRFFNYFKVKPHLIIKERCRIGSKKIYEQLEKEFGSFYSYKWTAPNLENNLLKIWLRAFFDCEAWVMLKAHQNRAIGLECVNYDGIISIKKFLKKLGIESSEIKKKKSRAIFSLHIYGKENLIKFRELIGFNHPQKRELLNRAINDYINYEWQFPNEQERLLEFVKWLIKEKAKIKRPNGIFRIISNKEINLILLQERLKDIFKIESKVKKRKNGIGNIYFELNVNKNREINKLIKNNLVNEECKQEWLKLKK